MSAGLKPLFAGRRGRLLAGLLLAEFATAVDGLAYATVLPLASAELDGARLYVATLTADGLATLLVLGVAGPVVTRWPAARVVLAGTLAYLAGSLVSAGAPAMGWLLAGTIVRGGAGGLLAGLGLAAVGGLYDDDVRPRVMGLFGLVWLVPSIAGPVLNAALTSWLGWRAAMAWPCLLMVAARIVIGRYLDLVPWQRSTSTVPAPAVLVVVTGLAVAGAAGWVARAIGGSGVGNGAGWGALTFTGGAVVALVAARSVAGGLLVGHPQRRRPLAAFTGLCLAWYAASAVLPLALVDGMGERPLATNLAFCAGPAGWALSGIRPPRLGEARRRWDPADHPGVAAGVLVAGLVVTAALTVLAVGDAWPTPVGAVSAGAAWFAAGLGMGPAYNQVSSRTFDEAPAAAVNALGVAVAFAEMFALALGAAAGSGPYSIAPARGPDLVPALVVVFVVVVGAAAAAAARLLAPGPDPDAGGA